MRRASARGGRADIASAAQAGLRWEREAICPKHTDGGAGEIVGVPSDAASSSPGLVGRVREFATLERWLEESRTERGGLAMVSGPAGVGKSFLLREFARRAQLEGWAVAWGHVETGSRSQLPWPWPTILRSLPGEKCSRLARELASVALESVGRGSRPDAVLSGSRMDGGHLAFQLSDALEAAAEMQPTLVVVDDAQRLDALAVATLRMVAEVGNELPLLIVAAARSPGAESRGGEAVLEELSFQADDRVLILESLGAEDVASILGKALTLRLGGREAAARLTGGNPLLVRELLESSRVSSGEVGAEELAAGLRVLAVRCLHALAPEEREVVETAALLDEGFDAVFLARVLDRDLAEVERALESSAVASFFATDPGSDANALRFSHELLGEAIEAEIDPGARRELHARLALALEERAAQGVLLDPAVLAHHAYRGSPVFPSDRAARWALRAAREANASGARGGANLWVERGLTTLEHEADPESVSTRIDLLLEEFAANHVDEPDEALASLEAATRLAEGIGPAEVARLARGALEVDADGFDMAVEVRTRLSGLLDRALEANAGSETIRIDLLARKALMRQYLAGSHNLEESVASARAALEASESLSDDDVLRGFALCASLWCDRWGFGLEKRLAMAEESVRIAPGESGGILRTLVQAGLLMDHFALGDLTAAMKAAERFEELVARRPGHPMNWLPFQHRAAFATVACDAAGARQALEAGFEAAGPRLQGIARGGAMILQYQITEIFGPKATFGWDLPTDDALPAPTPASRATSLTNSPGHEPGFRAGLLKGLATLMPETAGDTFDELVRTDFVDFPRDRGWLAASALLAEACSQVEHVPAAERLWEMLRPFSNYFGSLDLGLTFAGQIGGFVAPLAALVGRFDEADALGARAIAENDRMGFPFYATRCRLERARMLLERGERSRSKEADALVSEASAAIERHAMAGLEPWLDALPKSASAETMPAQVAPDAPPEEPELWRDGDIWTVGWEGRAVQLKSQRGLEFLHALVREPGKSLHAQELMSQAASPVTSTAAAQRRDLALGEGEGLEVLDQTALRSYRSRLEELDAELAEAEEAADLGRAGILRREREAILEALRGATGLGGRMRKTGSNAERARTAVRKRIKAALDRIREELPGLHVHLSASLHTGVYCAYQPAEALSWKTEPPG